MKKSILGLSILLVSVLFLVGCDKNQENESVGDDYVVDVGDSLEPSLLFNSNNIEVESLTEEEKNGLIQMREEEKLAHDVYVTLYEKWGQNIFNNIAESEQTHTNTVRFLIEKYDVEDPVLDPTVGAFTSDTMQELYNSLTLQGSQSLEEALVVGAIIEDLDINDLDNLLKQTNNEDIKIAYQNLMKGSRNHMRVFVRTLEKNGGEYTPQYISEESYEKIISGEQERGNVNAQGRGSGQGRGMNRTQ